MGFTKATYAVDNISSLSDTPNATEGLTGAQLRAKFDKTGADGKTFVNSLVDELDSSVALQNSGWIKDTTTTFSYTSATRIATSVDLTALTRTGDKIKYIQGGVTKYGYNVGIASTYINILSGTDYTVANEPITEFYYSHEDNPIGFPQWFNYTPALSNCVLGSGTNEAKFNIVGKQVNIYGIITFGSGMSVSGNVLVSLPIMPTFDWGNNFNAMLHDFDSNYYVGTAIVSGNNVMIASFVCISSYEYYPYTIPTNVTTPFTWVSEDTIHWKGSYIL